MLTNIPFNQTDCSILVSEDEQENDSKYFHIFFMNEQ